jgi:MraZ protein
VASFRGANYIAIDAKGRFAVPSKYRVSLEGSSIVVTVDTEDKCLLMYSLSAWLEIEAKVESLPSFNPVTRKIKRLLIGNAVELDLDASGRLLLPKNLRDYALLDKKAVLVGQGKKIEIWGADMWQQSCESWSNESILTANEIPDELKALVL